MIKGLTLAPVASVHLLRLKGTGGVDLLRGGIVNPHPLVIHALLSYSQTACTLVSDTSFLQKLPAETRSCLCEWKYAAFVDHCVAC
jgi:hypothetical protein